MNYGEKLFARVWHTRFSGKFIFYRFRFDPVPAMGYKRGNFYCWCKRPKSTNEKRQWFASEGYGRLKRSPFNLPDPWDDYQRGDVRTRKSWKNRKVKKQYIKNNA
jgi:hypothetical protein